MFNIDLYRDDDGQIEFSLLGPYDTGNHYYQYCDEMATPSWDDTVPCYVGTFSNFGDGKQDCRVCSAGTYQNQTGQSTCKDCPAGKYNLDDHEKDQTFHDSASDCIAKECPPGWYLAEAAKTSTITTAFSISIDCVMCEAGKYKTVGGDGSCTDCEAGKYGKTQGAQSCAECAMGKYSSGTGATTCTLCDRGKYNEDVGSSAISDCVNCGAGRYSSMDGATSRNFCNLCPEGKARSTVGAVSESNCLSCAIGKYNRKTGALACEDCAAGTYASQEETFECDVCQYGKKSDHVGATNADTCVDCEQGKYSGRKGATECKVCETPLVIKFNASQCVEEDFAYDDNTSQDGGGNGGDGGDGGDQGGDDVAKTPSPTSTPAPTPTPLNLDAVDHECTTACPEIMFESCDPSFFQHPCSNDCDATVKYIYETFFDQNCPSNFKPPPIGFIEIDSGFQIERLKPSKVIASKTDRLYMIKILKHGIAKLVDGVVWKDVIITNLGGLDIMSRENAEAQNGSRRGRRLSEDVTDVKFKIVAPVANVADANGEEAPNVAKSDGQQKSKTLSADLWKDMEENFATKSVIEEGMKETDPNNAVQTDLATSLRTEATVATASLEAPKITIKIEGEIPQEKGEGEADGFLGAQGEVTMIVIFSVAGVAFLISGYVYKRHVDNAAILRKYSKESRGKKPQRPSKENGGGTPSPFHQSTSFKLTESAPKERR